MKSVDTELTLATLLADPLTQAVMRSDNITVADTARAFDQAGQAINRPNAPDLAVWRPTRHPPYRRL